MADENTDDLCKDCGPALTAFLEGMADQNKEHMELNTKVTCQLAVRSMNTRFRILRKRLSHPALLPDERNSCSKKVAGQDLSLPWLLKRRGYTY